MNIFSHCKVFRQYFLLLKMLKKMLQRLKSAVFFWIKNEIMYIYKYRLLN